MSFPETRLRRFRRTPTLRRLVRETRLSPDNLVLPLFICPGEGVAKPVGSMPGVYQQSVDKIVETAREAYAEGIRSLLLFGLPDFKDAVGSAAWSPDGIVQRALRALSKELPDLVKIVDVCFCEYTDHGHCGVLHGHEVDNDATLENLAKQSVSLAEAGADVIAPSDMMDGRGGSDPQGAGRGRILRDPHPLLCREVRQRLLRPVPRGRRVRAAVRRPPCLPDGPGQRPRGLARGRGRRRGRGRTC